MARQMTVCDRCGYRVRWDPETRDGPREYFEEGDCPSCGESFEDRAPVSARRGSKRQ
jgi:C4-type Zn-finger protein